MTKPANDDLRLYRQITQRVAHGQDYYQAVATEHRFNHYPLKPFFVVRLPTLALVSAWLGTNAVQIAAIFLVLTICLAWRHRIASTGLGVGARMVAVVVIFAGLLPMFNPNMLGLHELWAGGLVTLSLALWRPDRFWPSLILGGTALFIRETTLPFILLMGANALWDKSWREFGLWTLIVLAFGCAMIFHFEAVMTVTTADDIVSQGWVSTGGWSAYLSFVHQSSILRFLPFWMTSILAPLAFLGWASCSSRTATLILLLQAGYALTFMTVGRAENYYWGLLVTPTLYVGLIFVPATLASILARIQKWSAGLNGAKSPSSLSG